MNWKNCRMAAEVLERDGTKGLLSKLAQRLARRAEAYFGWPEGDFPLLWEDVVTDVSAETEEAPEETGLAAMPKLKIAWVCLPPSAGSGGHTTLFRMVQAMEDRGHECFIYLYDRKFENAGRHVQTIRAGWPGLRAEIRSARPSIEGMDAVVASSWETAHVVASRAVGSQKRFYFIQDYEPFFYPRGELSELAERTYGFGFTMIALGSMVAHCVETYAGKSIAHCVPFGCDTEVYWTASSLDVARSGVVFYAKKQADRRAYWLAKKALEVFHERHPEHEIHVVGDLPTGWKIPVILHGSVRPWELNEIYNRSLAGIALSFTNISLAAEEMLAAGLIPVVNDSLLARMDLAGDGPLWVEPTPQGIADGLSRLVEMEPQTLENRRRSSMIRQGWESTGREVAAIVEGGFWSAKT